MFEYKGHHPHIILLIAMDAVGADTDGSVSVGELAPIITAIRNRMNQKEFKDEVVFPVSPPPPIFLLFVVFLLTSLVSRFSYFHLWADSMAGYCKPISLLLILL